MLSSPRTPPPQTSGTHTPDFSETVPSRFAAPIVAASSSMFSLMTNDLPMVRMCAIMPDTGVGSMEIRSPSS